MEILNNIIYYTYKYVLKYKWWEVLYAYDTIKWMRRSFNDKRNYLSCSI